MQDPSALAVIASIWSSEGLKKDSKIQKITKKRIIFDENQRISYLKQTMVPVCSLTVVKSLGLDVGL